jgi:hypothetical protein
MSHTYYSQRAGSNPHPDGLPFHDIVELFMRIYSELEDDGYFQESFGYECVDAGFVPGSIRDPNKEILLAVSKRDLWPIHEKYSSYNEDDFFDMIEFLFQNVSKPVNGYHHTWNNCGWHWDKFDRPLGRIEYCVKINSLLEQYTEAFELASTGDVLHKPEYGFAQLITADIPINDNNVTTRMNAAVSRYRKHGATIDDRRQVVRDLADVLEYIRPSVKAHLTTKDEGDLFNLANNFGVRHHNDKQKTDYDASIWLNWMFYFYLSTIHVVLRKMNRKIK